MSDHAVVSREEWTEARRAAQAVDRLRRVGMLAGLIVLGAVVYFAVLLVSGLRPRDLRVRNPREG